MTTKNNIKLTLRERGKIVQRWEGHNIWLDTGRDFLRHLMSYPSFSPLTTAEDRRIRYLGFGIGGRGQTQPAIANNPPLSVDFPGTNIQTDLQPDVLRLERPVTVTSGVFLYALPPPVLSSTHFSATFSATLATTVLSHDSYTAMPISEVALYLAGADDSVGNNEAMAYEVFETIVKTQGYTLDVDWAVRF